MLNTRTPAVRDALLAALCTPSHTLKRGCGGFVAFDGPVKRSGPTTYQAVTLRTINRMREDGLVKFDEPEFPRVITLTDAGIAAARELQATRLAKAVRA